MMFGPFDFEPDFEVKKKPCEVCRMPYTMFRNSSANIDKYIRKSPMLDWLDEHNVLIYLVATKNVIFMCTNQASLEQCKKQFSDNVGLYPVMQFIQDITPKQNHFKKKKLNTLRQILQKKAI